MNTSNPITYAYTIQLDEIFYDENGECLYFVYAQDQNYCLYVIRVRETSAATFESYCELNNIGYANLTEFDPTGELVKTQNYHLIRKKCALKYNICVIKKDNLSI